MTPQGRNECLQFPVFLYGQLLDIRTYTPGASHEQKMRSRTNSMAGLILPYDVWHESPKTRITLLCAGEKDMAVARSKGFNAITNKAGARTDNNGHGTFLAGMIAGKANGKGGKLTDCVGRVTDERISATTGTISNGNIKTAPLK